MFNYRTLKNTDFSNKTILNFSETSIANMRLNCGKFIPGIRIEISEDENHFNDKLPLDRIDCEFSENSNTNNEEFEAAGQEENEPAENFRKGIIHVDSTQGLTDLGTMVFVIPCNLSIYV